MKLIKLTAVGSASAIQFAILAISSLVLAKLITVESFGITRIVTAYMVVLTILGHFCLQDAVAAYVAGARNSFEKAEYIICGTYLTLAISLAIVIVAEIVINSCSLWKGELKLALSATVLFLPAACLAIVYSSVFQAIGSYKKLIICTILEGLVPAFFICSGSAIWELKGWVGGRCGSYLIILLIDVLLIKIFFSKIKVHSKTIYDLIKFARIQILSGLLSMILQVMDVFAIERLSGNLSEVAVYGLASQFTKSVVFLPGAIGRVYFQEIAEKSINMSRDFFNLVCRFICTTVIVCLCLAVAVAFFVPKLIQILYGNTYINSIPILKILCIGIVATGLWTALSIINIAIKKPSYSLCISLTGVTVGTTSLYVLVPSFNAIGAAWAMNCSYFIGGVVGLSMLVLHIRRMKISH